MNKVNLFLPITPYTLAISESLIAKKFYSNGYTNILINPHGLLFNSKLWDKVYEDKVSREVSENKIWRYFNFAQQIRVF